MDMNVYVMEKLMFQKQIEIENNIRYAWQRSHLKESKNGLLHKITTLFLIKKGRNQVNDCCCC